MDSVPGYPSYFSAVLSGIDDTTSELATATFWAEATAASASAGAGFQFGLAAGEAFGAANSIVLGSGASVDLGTGTVLSGYVEVGGVVGGQTMNISAAVWNGLTAAEQDGLMSGFIDSAVDNGAQIVFANNPTLAQAGSGLAFEYQYITQTLRYTIVQQGTSWVALP